MLPPANPVSWRREHWLLASLVAALSVFASLVMPTWASAVRHDVAAPGRTTLELPLPTYDQAITAHPSAAIDPVADAAGSANEDWRVLEVKRGQTLGELFHAQGLSATDLQRILDAHVDNGALSHIHPGDEFAFRTTADGHLAALRFDRDEHTRVVVRLDGDRLRTDLVERQVEQRVHVAHGIVESSLFDAGTQAGMSDAMVLKLAQAFGYDIDFAQDLRVGDSFTVIYDDIYREGERLRDGDIVAATFINAGKRYTAVRYVDSEGNVSFYSEDGRPMKKSFLRTPVDFTRITSGFSAGRLHPILGTMRAHRGVDYAAPSGTPIYAAGDGRIGFAGVQPGYGNVIVIQHAGNYSTLYGHMSRFAAGLAQGQRVRQGQLIGYVGMTGLATGPHLHYEFRVAGVHQDPLNVTLPKPEPLPGRELERFRLQAQPLLARLKTLEAPLLASAH